MARRRVAPTLGAPTQAEGCALHSIRILVGPMPLLLREILREVLGSQSDMEIVREVDSAGELLSAVVEESPAVIVVESAMERLGEEAESILLARPGAHVVGLSSDGHSAVVYRLRASGTVVPEVSPEGLRQAIRSAVIAGEPA